MTFSHILLVALTWICFGRDIPLFKTRCAPVRPVWSSVNCTVSDDQSHCLGSACAVASGLSASARHLLSFGRRRRTRSWCPWGCGGPGPGILPPSSPSSMGTAGEPSFHGASTCLSRRSLDIFLFFSIIKCLYLLGKRWTSSRSISCRRGLNLVLRA